MPLELDKLTPEEQLKVLANRKPQKKAVDIVDNLDGDTFSANNYLKKVTRKK